MNYQSISNQKLIEIAEKKGIIITSVMRNELMAIRMVENDTKATRARQSMIAILQSVDSQRMSKYSLTISVMSLMIAIVAIWLSH